MSESSSCVYRTALPRFVTLPLGLCFKQDLSQENSSWNLLMLFSVTHLRNTFLSGHSSYFAVIWLALSAS